VTAVRRLEFAEFPDFTTPEAVARIPDPQAPETFERSRLRWNERTSPPHAASLALYTALLTLRRAHHALAGSSDTAGDASAAGAAGLVMRRRAAGEEVWVIATLRGDGMVTAATSEGRLTTAAEVLLTTEDVRFTAEPAPMALTLTPDGLTVRFDRPGAIVLRAAAPAGSR
jgi:maltooligosyltrehalose trehalohydrolase